MIEDKTLGNDSAGSEKKRKVRKKRWLPPVWVWVILALYLAVAAWMRLADPFEDHSRTVVFTILLALVAALTVILWFLLFSGQRWWIRLLVLAGVVLCLFGFRALVRIDHLSGELVPGLAWRFARKPDQRLEKPPLADPAGRSAVDLNRRTADDFPQFLGPDRSVGIDHLKLARDWETQPPERIWRQEIGAGWSGFAVVNGYAVTMEQRGELEMVTCYDVASGEMMWAHSVASRFETTLGGVGPRVTPTIDDGWVYAVSARGRLLALDGATGRPHWERDLAADYGLAPEEEARQVRHGRTGSPLVVGELLVVPANGSQERPVSLVAYDKKTGERVWEGGDRRISYASPAVATLGGVGQILIVTRRHVSGHDPATGKVLWEREWGIVGRGSPSVSQAVPVAPNRVFLSKGYGVGAALVELVPKGDGTFDSQKLWQSSAVMRTKFTNVALRDGYVYGLSDGILECIELATGRRTWKGGRYKHGQILRVGELLLVLTETGEVVLVEATPERRNQVLGRFAAIAGKTWNTFALYGPYLLVRNAREAACYKLPLGSSSREVGRTYASAW